jgi:protoheme IX farnesyltransferase
MIVSKPGIAAGVALAGFTGMVLASRGAPPPLTALACTACILLAAAGSAMANALAEADTDALMPRVAAREKALSMIGRTAVLRLSAGLIISAMLIAFATLNFVSGLLLAAAVISYTFLYTLVMKRRSPYGTVAGAIPGALPVLIGYSAVNPHIGLDGVILFFIMLLWQPPHFLALALKHKDEYAVAGIPVMPVALGEPYTKVFLFMYSAALPPLTLSLWLFGYCSAYFAGAASLMGLIFIFVYYKSAVQARRFGRAFGASIVYIMAVLLAVVLDVGLKGVILRA